MYLNTHSNTFFFYPPFCYFPISQCSWGSAMNFNLQWLRVASDVYVWSLDVWTFFFFPLWALDQLLWLLPHLLNQISPLWKVHSHLLLFVSGCLALSWCGYSPLLIAHFLVLATVSQGKQHICLSMSEYFVMKNTASLYLEDVWHHLIAWVPEAPLCHIISLNTIFLAVTDVSESSWMHIPIKGFKFVKKKECNDKTNR